MGGRGKLRQVKDDPLRGHSHFILNLTLTHPDAPDPQTPERLKVRHYATPHRPHPSRDRHARHNDRRSNARRTTPYNTPRRQYTINEPFQRQSRETRDSRWATLMKLRRCARPFLW